jgi:hypothetical protein
MSEHIEMLYIAVVGVLMILVLKATEWYSLPDMLVITPFQLILAGVTLIAVYIVSRIFL